MMNPTPPVTTTTVTEPFTIHGVSQTSPLTVPAVVSPFGEVKANTVLAYGTELEISPELVEASRDRLGASIFEMTDDDQILRWGEVKFARGAWPADQPRHVPGSFEWADARESAQKAAWAHTDTADRAAARRAVEVNYGAPAATSQTLSTRSASD